MNKKPFLGLVMIGLIFGAGAFHLSQRPNDYIGESLNESKFFYPFVAWLLLTLIWWGLTLSYPLHHTVWDRLGKFLAQYPLVFLLIGLGFGLFVAALPHIRVIQSLAYYLAPYPALISLGFWLWLGLLSQNLQKIGGSVFKVGMMILISLILLEGLLRLFPLPLNHPVQIQKHIMGLFKSEAAFGWSLRPDYHFIWASEGEFENEIRLNSLGQHDIERTYTRSDDIRRVLVIGDSFVEALQVPLPQTPTQIAEKCLASEHPTEILNGGISATGTGQQLRFWQHQAYQYQPDMVIVSVYLLNDLNDNERVRDWMVSLYGSYSFSFEAESIQTHYIEPWRTWLDWGADYLESLRLWRAMLRLQSHKRDSLQIPIFLSPDFEKNVYASWQLELELLRAFQADVEKRGIEFGVMLVPSRAELDPPAVFGDIPPNLMLEPFLAYETLRKFIESDLKSALTDVYPPIRAAYPQEALYFPEDGHFNARGYQLMGETLCQALGD